MAGSGRHGNINNVDTTGASWTTSQGDNLGYAGVPWSETMAKNDASEMAKLKHKIEQAAASQGMDPAVIAGIISRETRGGSYLKPTGFGDDGTGYGVMQVDKRWYPVRGAPDSLEHIKQGAGILREQIDEVKKMHPEWTDDMALKGGISAYNAGSSTVKSYENVDAETTGNDYANDVVARSQWYKANGY